MADFITINEISNKIDLSESNIINSINFVNNGITSVAPSIGVKGRVGTNFTLFNIELNNIVATYTLPDINWHYIAVPTGNYRVNAEYKGYNFTKNDTLSVETLGKFYKINTSNYYYKLENINPIDQVLIDSNIKIYIEIIGAGSNQGYWANSSCYANAGNGQMQTFTLEANSYNNFAITIGQPGQTGGITTLQFYKEGRWQYFSTSNAKGGEPSYSGKLFPNYSYNGSAYRKLATFYGNGARISNVQNGSFYSAQNGGGIVYMNLLD